MTIYDDQALDQGWQALHETGPEFEGWLSNHGPMVVEALARRGRGEVVERWVRSYRTRLDDLPTAFEPITADTWRAALGDPRRLGDWPRWFGAQLDEQPWTEVLATWWPRLLPGVAAGATHGVIRVGHAANGLRLLGPNPDRLTELAHALGYWAARWQPVPAGRAAAGGTQRSVALTEVPRIADQTGGIRSRLAQLEDTSGWREAQRTGISQATAGDVPLLLRDLVSAAIDAYAHFGHANPVMLVHAATAPNAILRALPSLPADLWVASAHAAWSASAAIVSAYAPRAARPVTGSAPRAAADALDEAVHNGDEHAIKLVDTALDVYEWTGSDQALAAARLACESITA